MIPRSAETVPCAPNAANMGRDADTIGTMVGGISGAFAGRSGIKEVWTEKVLNEDSDQVELAEKLKAVVRKRLGDRQKRIEIAESLMAGQGGQQS